MAPKASRNPVFINSTITEIHTAIASTKRAVQNAVDTVDGASWTGAAANAARQSVQNWQSEDMAGLLKSLDMIQSQMDDANKKLGQGEDVNLASLKSQVAATDGPAPNPASFTPSLTTLGT